MGMSFYFFVVWSIGTVCDSGVFAPVLTFQKLFEDEGVPITSAEVRAPMGVHKRVNITWDKYFYQITSGIFTWLRRKILCFQIHIQKILETPSVSQRWLEAKGKAATDDDAERIYSKSLSATLDVLPSNSHLIRGKL